MAQLAIFVEGQTQLIFARRSLEEVAGLYNVTFEVTTPKGAKIERLIEIEAPGEQHRVLLYDCGNDVKVKSAILDNLASLRAAGYSLVLGLVDLHPRKREALGRFEAIDQPPGMPVRIIAQVMEMEAWFIAEHSHFSRWDARLTYEVISDRLGLDLPALNFEGIPVPTKTMNSIYGIFGKGYKKNKYFTEKVVGCLDFGYLYTDVRAKSGGIDRFFASVDDFLDS